MIEGRAERLDAEGNLVLRLADGSFHTVTAGEVTSKTPSPVPPSK
jgi:biotin-(acetyl-CoA carboxylase) ligase